MKQNWEYKKFEECICKVPKAKQVQTSAYNDGTKYPIISQEDKLISGYCDDESMLFQIKSPVVIFGDHTRVLKYIDFNFVVGADGVKILQPKDFLEAKFLLYYLKWYNVPNLGYSRHYKLLKEIKVPTPQLPVQQSIVAELDEINHLLSLKRQQLSAYDKLSQSLFYEMFGDPVVNDKGWEVKKLGEVARVGTGSTPNRNNEDYYCGSIPWVKSTEVCNCVIDATEEHISEKAFKETNCTIYPKGSILMAMYGQGKTRGQIAILNTEAATNQAVAAILLSECCDRLFVFQYLLLMYDNIRSIARGGNQANLNLTLVKSIPIPLPPLPLQERFASRIETIERQKTQVRKTIEKLERLLSSRMQYWFE